jgi:2-polyprenyl-3-methyl-5-hydroxy-6-metoxy-1,4-benzoquinol methylase
LNAVLKELEFRNEYGGCPLCGGVSLFLRQDTCPDRKRIDGRLIWLKCSNCRHVHTKTYFNEHGIAELFSQVGEDGIFGGNLDKQRERWGNVINKLLPYAKRGKWIDVGVGNGSFLFTAAEYGFDAIGIDARPYLLDTLKKFGYCVENADATSYDYDGATVVVLADVLEHIPYPKDLLKRIREKLDGALFVSCPNMDSVSWRYMDTVGNPYWTELEHYHNFTRVRLEALLKECGYTPVYYGVSPRYMAGMEIIAV